MKKQKTGVLLSVLTIICLMICLTVSVAALTNSQPAETSDTSTGLTFAEMFPDSNFRAYVTGTVLEDSTDAKGYNDQPTAAQMSIIESCTFLDVEDRSISSLKGISYFSALKSLFCNSNQLKTLDVSQNTALKYLNCADNQLTELDVSQNTALEHLYCYSNQLVSLDVSQSSALTKLSCYDNQLTELDVSQSSALTDLNCHGNQLTKLDVSQSSALTVLDCGSNKLTELDLSQNTNLSNIYVSPQSIPQTEAVVTYDGENYTLDLRELVPGIDLSRVTMNDGGSLDVSTGIVTYTKNYATTSYLYQTNSPNKNKMSVIWRTPVVVESTVLSGDLDGDGVLSSTDVVMLAKYLVGAVTLTDDQIAAADLNGDGAVTAADTVLLAKKLLSGN